MIPRSIGLPRKSSYFLFGPRQTGKSTLVNSTYTEKVWNVELLHSDQFLDYSRSPELFRKEAQDKLDSNLVSRIVVDEIQRIPLLLNEIHFLIEHYPDCQFILTGSSARKLKSAGTNLLGGRAVERRLFPFTVAELEERFDLETALRYGTLPSIIGKDVEDTRDILSAYVHTYLQEEIRSEGAARNLGAFSRFLYVAAAQNGESLNFAAIGRECKLSSKTVQGYYEILEDTLVAMRLDPWKKSIRKRLSAQPRYYFFDTGVTNALNRRLTAVPDPLVRGRLFEQFIILETFRILSYHRSEATLYYWRTSNGAEVDLIIEKHGHIAVACEIKSSSAVAGADCSGLRTFSRDYPLTPCVIICPARNTFSIGSVAVLPWRDYLRRLDEWI